MSRSNPTLDELRSFAKQLSEGDLFANRHNDTRRSGQYGPGTRIVKYVGLDEDDRDELLSDRVVATVSRPDKTYGEFEVLPRHTISVAGLYTRYTKVEGKGEEPEFVPGEQEATWLGDDRSED